MVFTDETKREFIEQLSIAKSRYSGFRTLPKALVKKSEPLMEDPFIASFLEMRKQQHGLTWDGFCIMMESFPDVLLSKFGIEIFAQRFDDIKKDDEFDKLTAVVGQASIEKTSAAARHDAYHIMIVHKLRKDEKPSELGTCYWFLTRDFTLERAEVQRYGSEFLPGSVDVDIWLSMISPLLSPTIVAEKGASAFSAILASRFPMLAQPVRPDELIEFMSLGLPEDFLDTDGLRKAIGNHYVRQYLQEVREARAKDEPVPGIAKILEPLIAIKTEELQKSMTKDFEARIEELKASFKESEKRMQKEFEVKSVEQETKLEESERRKWTSPRFLLLLGIIMLVLIPILPFFPTYFHISVPDIVYNCLMWAGVLLILASAFGKKAMEILAKTAPK